MPTQSEILNSVFDDMEDTGGRFTHWIMRWGLTVFFTVIAVAIFISSQISIHDTLSVTAILQAKEQPRKVTVSNQLAEQEFNLLVKNGDFVRLGDTLLIQYNLKNNSSIPMIAEMNGTICISKGNDESSAADQIISVVPQATGVEVQIKYSDKGVGNIKPGQSIRIALQDYPPSKYGYVDGYVASVLPVPFGEFQQAKITLKYDGIMTNTGHIIAIRPMMQGDGEILLNERSILGRIFGSIIP